MTMKLWRVSSASCNGIFSVGGAGYFVAADTVESAIQAAILEHESLWAEKSGAVSFDSDGSLVVDRTSSEFVVKQVEMISDLVVIALK